MYCFLLLNLKKMSITHEQIWIRYSTIKTKEADSKCGLRVIFFIFENWSFVNKGEDLRWRVNFFWWRSKSWEQFCVWTSLPNYLPITLLVKFFSLFIKRTTKTSASNSGLQLILEGAFTIAFLWVVLYNLF